MKDKIPFYNIVNMFFVGAVFSIMVILMFVEKINIEQNMELDKMNLLYYLQEEFLEKKE